MAISSPHRYSSLSDFNLEINALRIGETAPLQGSAHDFFVVFLRFSDEWDQPADAGVKTWKFAAGKRLAAAALIHSESDKIFKKLALYLHESNWIERDALKSFLKGLGIPPQKLAFNKKWLQEPLDLDIFHCRKAREFSDRAAQIVQSGKVIGTARQIEEALIAAIWTADVDHGRYHNAVLLEAGKIVFAAAQAHPEKEAIFKELAGLRACMKEEHYDLLAVRAFDAALASFAAPPLPLPVSPFRRSYEVVSQAVKGLVHSKR